MTYLRTTDPTQGAHHMRVIYPHGIDLDILRARLAIGDLTREEACGACAYLLARTMPDIEEERDDAENEAKDAISRANRAESAAEDEVAEAEDAAADAAKALESAEEEIKSLRASLAAAKARIAALS